MLDTSIKRVVTGIDAEGTSLFVEDSPLPATELALMPGVQIFQVWGTEGPLHSPSRDPAPVNPTFFPGPGGTRFGLFRIPPEQDTEADRHSPDPATIAEQVRDAEANLPGLIGIFEPDTPGMHRTTSVDYVIVVEGELWLELDDGAQAHLPTGTCVVQNGTRHAWRNHGTVPATLAFVILDARTT